MKPQEKLKMVDERCGRDNEMHDRVPAEKRYTYDLTREVRQRWLGDGIEARSSYLKKEYMY